MAVLAGTTSVELSALTLHDVASLGTQYVDAAGRLASRKEAAGLLVDTLVDGIRTEEGAPALVLCRVYFTSLFAQLGSELQKYAQGLSREPLNPSTRCMVLVATRGRLRDWNRVETSRSHRAIPLVSESALRRFPMVSRLLEQLGFDVVRLFAGDGGLEIEEQPSSFNVFFVERALGNRYIPAQEDFVVRHGIASAFGFGGLLPDGEAFAVVCFSGQHVTSEQARYFRLLAVQARLALASPASSRHGERGGENLDARYVREVLQQLVDVQGSLLASWGAQYTEARRQAQERAARVSAQRRQEVQDYTSRLERSQRAMLNLVEDLREAHTRLEDRVAERTLELGRVNAELAVRLEELSRANSDLRDFAHVVSHDLQEPLRTVSGYLQLLDRRYSEDLPEEAREFIAFAVGGVNRMHELIQSLLRYARLSRGEPFGRVLLDDALDDALANLQIQVEDAEAVIERGPLPVVLGDRMQLTQLLQNLIGNALKFRGDAPARVEVRAAQVDEMWRVEVTDHGVGFDSRFRTKIFRIFKRLQRQTDGTGIGLAICKKVVESHGGMIDGDGVPGEGARFWFTLPVPKESP